MFAPSLNPSTRTVNHQITCSFRSFQWGPMASNCPLHLLNLQVRFKIVCTCSLAMHNNSHDHCFADGLYVLLKPQKKKKHISAVDLPKVPSNLMQNVMPNVPDPNCQWSLSGPQFPQPTAIQQRYCYPKGEAEYSSKKGGALWTMVRSTHEKLVKLQNLNSISLILFYSTEQTERKTWNIVCFMSTSRPSAQLTRVSRSRSRVALLCRLLPPQSVTSATLPLLRSSTACHRHCEQRCLPSPLTT